MPGPPLKTRVGDILCTCREGMSRADIVPYLRATSMEVDCRGRRLLCACSNLQLPDAGVSVIQTNDFRQAAAQAVCGTIGTQPNAPMVFTVEAEAQRGLNLVFLGVVSLVAGGGFLWWITRSRKSQEPPQESPQENPYADTLVISEAVMGELMPIYRPLTTIHEIAQQWAREVYGYMARWPLATTRRVLDDLVRAGIAVKSPSGDSYRTLLERRNP